MADPVKIMARVRARGANVILDGGRLKIIHGKKLPAEALQFIKDNAAAVADCLEREAEFEERAAIIEHDGGLPRPAAEDLASILLASPPKEISPADWTWFVGKAAAIADQRRAAAA